MPASALYHLVGDDHFTPRSRLFAIALSLSLCFGSSFARPSIKSDFFSLYPGADGTQLTDLPSNSKHCGVCHFDFDGKDRRNPYGVVVEAIIQLGCSNTNAMIAIQDLDSGGDGYTNLEEITNSVFNNTPTFPGYSSTNTGWILNVPTTEVDPYLTPDGSSDTTPPSVTLLTPNSGDFLVSGGFSTAAHTASDANGSLMWHSTTRTTAAPASRSWWTGPRTRAASPGSCPTCPAPRP